MPSPRASGSRSFRGPPARASRWNSSRSTPCGTGESRSSTCTTRTRRQSLHYWRLEVFATVVFFINISSDDDDTSERVFEDALVVHDLASDTGGRRELCPGLVGDHPERILGEHRVVVDGGDRVGFATPLVQLPHRPAGRALSNSEQVGQGTTGHGRQVPGHGDFQVANLIVGRMLADVVHIVTVEGDRALGLGTGQTNLECGAP